MRLEFLKPALCYICYIFFTEWLLKSSKSNIQYTYKRVFIFTVLIPLNWLESQWVEPDLPDLTLLRCDWLRAISASVWSSSLNSSSSLIEMSLRDGLACLLQPSVSGGVVLFNNRGPVRAIVMAPIGAVSKIDSTQTWKTTDYNWWLDRILSEF